MTQQFYALLSLLLSVAAFSVVYALYAFRREKSFVPWLITWGLTVAHFILLLMENPEAPGTWVLARWATVLTSLSLIYAAREYAHLPRRLPVIGFLAVVAGLWTAQRSFAWQAEGEYHGPMLMGAAFSLWAAGSFWERRRQRTSVAVRMLAVVCLVWFGFDFAAAMMPAAALQPLFPYFLSLSLFNLLMMAMGMLILCYEAVLMRVEDNMMSFSMLNLATTGQQTNADMARMIEKVLERVLDVYGTDRGLIVVNPGSRNGTEADSDLHVERAPSTRVFRGWPAGFAEEWQRLQLEDRLSDSIARLGGLLSVPGLNDPGVQKLLDPPPLPPAKSAASPALSDILRSAGVGSLIAVTIRTQKRVYGALLLAPRPWALYTSAELRMLSSLGVQVGMGVENFLLMKAASRRSEELNLLNQTGRAISSTLESDPLLRRIHEELQKLMDAGNFYVAMIDDARQEIRFELEVEAGRYLPRRTRKVRRGLTEHLLQTEHAVLLRTDAEMTDFQRQNGVEQSGRPARSWCGAPVVIRGRAVGVMAVQSYEHENAYDEDHLEILRIVAAQASVALENARLFAVEQERSRQLTFLHNITAIAISTMNAEEMLQEIAREIQNNFAFDYIGIGILDYETKLVEWKAEAGSNPQRLLGRKVALDTGLIGRAARAGKPLLMQTSENERFIGMLETSRSGACLPITYAEQLLGVLNIESGKANGLRSEDLPILQTMAGHLSTALHNAFTFQRTQEQAITDGLTGVKTHRFFVEALHNEWKRATRSGRVFSLLVLDLDRFKQVNDTLGHLEGDLVLVRLGRILEERCRKSNVVARYGGDEFMVLMPETTTEQAHKLADRLRLWIATDPMFSERHLTASFGLATYPTHGHTPEEIIRVADAGLYMAKHQGGNHVAVADQFRQQQKDLPIERWRDEVFTPVIGGLRDRSIPTGPEALEKLVRALDSAWQENGAEISAQDFALTAEKGLSEIADLLEDRFHNSGGHQNQVTKYAMMMANAMGLDAGQSMRLRVAARLHDVGYLAVPAEVLENHGKLANKDFAAIHVHAGAGARLLQAARMESEVCDVVRHHHEFYNGRGYPDGLPGDRVPLGARILAVADVFDALTGERPYRKSRSVDEALEEMERFAGTQLDEALVRTFVRAMKSEAGQEVLS